MTNIKVVKAQFLRYVDLIDHMKYMSDEENKILKGNKHFSTITPDPEVQKLLRDVGENAGSYRSNHSVSYCV